MHIGILSTTQHREDERLKDAAEARGHSATIIDLMKCSISAGADKARVYHKGQIINDEFDAIIPRINVNYTYFGLAVLRQFQALGVYTTDTAYSLELGRDKLRCLQYLMRHSVPFPQTGFAYSKEDFDTIIRTVGGTPLVIKLIEGTEGAGIFLAEEDRDAKNLLKTFQSLDVSMIVQEFIKESAGTDLRCFVVGDEIVASMKRFSTDGDFRANISLGGHSEAVDITEQEREIVFKACKAIGINIAGVDVIRSDKGPLVLEINVSPDFSGRYGLEEVSGIDVADAIIAYIEKNKKSFDKGGEGWLDDKIDPV